MIVPLLIALWVGNLALARPTHRLPFHPSTYATETDAPCSISGLQGAMTDQGACRYTFRYAQTAERWGCSYLSTDFTNTSTTSLPPSCPQSGTTYVQGKTSEDCLYATVYTPKDAQIGSSLPVFVWVHGGSFVGGGASAPGPDGSILAKKGLVVIIMQYRLGVLGFIPPVLAQSKDDPNLGLLDLINGLKAVQLHVAEIGGDARKVTIGGQSSGAGMIRSLLGAPSAMGLFRAAILQSDTMSYGLASPSTTAQLRDAFYSSSPMASCRSLACLQDVSLVELLGAQDDLLAYAPSVFEGVPLAEVIRPTHSTSTIPYDPTPLLFGNPNGLFLPPSRLPLIITTPRNEGGSAIQALFPVPIPLTNATLQTTLTGLVGRDRAAQIARKSAYTLEKSDDALRNNLERIVTDGVWRCPNRDVAGAWARAGGDVWVGEWEKGVTYPTNQGTYCQADGRVCHEDDIYPTFGTGSGSLDEVIDRWASFITHLDPNYSRMRTRGRGSRSVRVRREELWEKYSSSRPEAVYALGGGEVTQCSIGGWGGEIAYDWKLYP